MQIHKQAWFVEGIAEYLSGHSFYSKNDLRKSVTMNKVSWNRFTGKNPQDMSWQELQIKYSYYRYFIEFLVETYGISKLQEYIKLYLHDPDTYSELFMKVYSTDLDEILKVYFSKLRNGE